MWILNGFLGSMQHKHMLSDKVTTAIARETLQKHAIITAHESKNILEDDHKKSKMKLPLLIQELQACLAVQLKIVFKIDNWVLQILDHDLEDKVIFNGGGNVMTLLAYAAVGLTLNINACCLALDAHHLFGSLTIEIPKLMAFIYNDQRVMLSPNISKVYYLDKAKATFIVVLLCYTVCVMDAYQFLFVVANTEEMEVALYLLMSLNPSHMHLLLKFFAATNTAKRATWVERSLVSFNLDLENKLTNAFKMDVLMEWGQGHRRAYSR
ncbi:hypothetical protein RIF29_33351 [Crotalaria pallida]|uniref:Uncharacterized protein n=1 Tax=Crotalaria pallida TaxID=3830 RepID=A0AAN9E7Q5_CROPI